MTPEEYNKKSKPTNIGRIDLEKVAFDKHTEDKIEAIFQLLKLVNFSIEIEKIPYPLSKYFSKIE